MEFHQEVEEEVVFNPPPPYDHVEEIEDDEIDEEDDDDDDDDYDYDDDYEDEDREEEVDDEDSEEEEEEEEDEEEEEEEEEASPVIPSIAVASPYVVIHHGRKNCKQTMYSMSEGIYSVRSVPPEMHGMSCCCASSNGWMLMLDNTTKRRSNCFLLNLTSMEKIELPPKKTSYTYINCILSSSPPDCLVMFVSAEDNSCLFCRPNKDHKWTIKVFGPKGNNNGNGFKYLNACVSCKGKIYISFGYGSGIKILDYKEEENDEGTIGNRFMVEKIKFETNLDNQFETFHNSKISTDLVESCGDVFMVVRILLGGSDDLSTLDVYTFNVFKLDSSSSSSSSNNGGKISWKKVESLGDDRVFLVDSKCSLSASASKTGLMANHIYFFQSYDVRYMYKFKMGSGLITNTLCFPHLVHPVDEPYWML